MDQIVDQAAQALERAYVERDFTLVEPYMMLDVYRGLGSESIGPLRGVYHGFDGARRLFEGFGEAFSEVRRTTRSTRRLGRRVLVQATVTARGAGSGIETTAGTAGAEIWTLVGDRIARAELVQQLDAAWRSIRLACLEESRLYFVGEAPPNGEDPRALLDAALRGGVDIVQLRDPDLSDEELIAGVGAVPRRRSRRRGPLHPQRPPRPPRGLRR